MESTLEFDLPADVRATVVEFESAADALLKPFVIGLEATPPPSLIYHYTSARGLKGILNSGKLWLTNAFQLNDRSELSHGVKVLNDRFAMRLEGSQPEVRVFAEQFWRFSVGGGIAASAHYFVGSLSLLGDDLTQWTRYADDGRGFALAFDTAILESAFAQAAGTSWNAPAFPIHYDEAVMVELFEPLIDLVVPYISYPRRREMQREVRNQYLSELSTHFALAALQRNLFFKHGGFRSESEYRFLEIHRHDRPPAVETRRRDNGTEATYRELDWLRLAPGSLRAIVSGPSAGDAPDVFAKLHYWLERAGLANSVARQASVLPYRSFLPPPNPLDG